ncbi:hypothetical protein TL16_g13136, partial [Triparma laevis f. inornata]
AIKLGQQLTFHLAEVNIIITKVTNMCDGKTKVSTGSLVPDSVEEALATSKHTLSVLLPKFNKMMTATKESGLSSAAGTVMLAMRWKNKAFGKKRSNHFGSIRVAPGGSPIGTVGGGGGGSTGANAQVANALADAKKEAMADLGDLLGEGGEGGETTGGGLAGLAGAVGAKVGVTEGGGEGEGGVRLPLLLRPKYRGRLGLGFNLGFAL